MAIGDQADMHRRLLRVIPPWFGLVHPKLDAFLQGPAAVLAYCYELYAFAKLQTRITTATGGWLDFISYDFFGTALPRKAGQTDASFRAIIKASLLRERATRNSVIQVLTDITGRTPSVYEPWRNWDNNSYNGPGGYNCGRPYGSTDLAWQAFVVAYRPDPAGPFAGTTDADIYAAVNSVRPAGTVLWVQIRD